MTAEVPITSVKLIAVQHHQNPLRSSKSDSACIKCKTISESNSELRKISQHSLTKLQNEGQVTIRTLHGMPVYRFHFCMNKWTLSYGQDWEQIIKLQSILP